MADESFLSRWSRRKAEAANANPVPEPPAHRTAPVQAPAEAVTRDETNAARMPTLEDVARLAPGAADTDLSPFVARGVDEAVKRAALKKLFADPHFNLMDGLDVYIADFNKSVPLQPEVLAALRHARDLLDATRATEEPAPPEALPGAPVEAAIESDSTLARRHAGDEYLKPADDEHDI